MLIGPKKTGLRTSCAAHIGDKNISNKLLDYKNDQSLAVHCKGGLDKKKSLSADEGKLPADIINTASLDEMDINEE